MAQYTIKDFRLNAVPSTWEPNSRYYILNGQGTDIDEYVTDLSGIPHKVNPVASSSGSVTSVALTMPTAFSVTGTPVTGAGTLAVTAIGNASQYIKGDGTLETFPTINSGTVISVGSGNGMNFTPFTTTGTITLGTPSSITLATANALTTNSHTHAFAPGGTTAQYIRGDGSLGTTPIDTNLAISNLTQNGNRIYQGSGFNYDLNNLGEWNFNLATGKDFSVNNAYQVYLESVSGTKTSNFYLLEDFLQFYTYESTSGGACTVDLFSTEALGPEVFMSGRIGGVQKSEFVVRGGPTGKIIARPYQGNFEITNLTNLSGQNRIIGQDSSTTGIGYINIGSGLSLNSGVLSASGGAGTVTNITSGNGMNFSTISTTGAITLGTPSNITLVSGNALTSNSHSHAFVPGGTSSQYIAGDGSLITFPTGFVTSVTGTTDRITSTGGTTPIINISATFEALLGKVANPLSQFASTTSAQLAGVISDETGTGNLVFNTSPVFTTPRLASSSTSGYVWTATDNLGNGSFQALSGSGTVTDFVFTNGNGFNGSVSTSTTIPTLSLTTSLTTTHIPVIGASGSLTGSSSLTYNGSLNVVGDIKGTANLSIQDRVAFQQGAGSAPSWYLSGARMLALRNDNVDYSEILVKNLDLSGGILNTPSTTDLSFRTNNTERGVFDGTTGNFGIGTNTPYGKQTTILANRPYAVNGTTDWDDKWALFSSGSGSRDYGLGFSYQTSNNAWNIVSVAPATAWSPINMYYEFMQFFSLGAVTSDLALFNGKVNVGGGLVFTSMFNVGNAAQFQVDGSGNIAKMSASAYSTGGYDVLVLNQTTGVVEKTTISAGGVTITEAELDFGGTINSNTSLTINDSSILSTSKIIVTLSGETTVDHDMDEVLMSDVRVVAGNIINGVSFEIRAYSPGGTTGKYKVNYTIDY